MAAWCVSAKSSASWRVTHGLNQPHEHFALVPRVMWLTKMRLCSFIGVSRSGGGEDVGLNPFGLACGELSGAGTGRAHDSHHLAAQGRGGGDCLNGAQRQRDGRHADVAATGEQKRDSAGQARQDRHGENVPASLERQTVRVHAQGGVSAVPVGGEAEQWHGSFLSLWGLALILPRNRPRRGGTEADQTRPSRWRVAAFRATVRPRASRYVQPQEHTACQPLRRSHPDSAVWVLAASATVAAMSRRRAARSVSPFRSAMSAPVVRWRMLFCISVSLLSSPL